MIEGTRRTGFSNREHTRADSGHLDRRIGTNGRHQAAAERRLERHQPTVLDREVHGISGQARPEGRRQPRRDLTAPGRPRGEDPHSSRPLAHPAMATATSSSTRAPTTWNASSAPQHERSRSDGRSGPTATTRPPPRAASPAASPSSSREPLAARLDDHDHHVADSPRVGDGPVVIRRPGMEGAAIGQHLDRLGDLLLDRAPEDQVEAVDLEDAGRPPRWWGLPSDPTVQRRARPP